MRSSPNYEPESRTWNSTEKYSWKLRMNAPVSCCNVGLSGRNSATPAISCSREDPSVNRVARARTSRLQVIGIEPCCRKLRRTRRWALPTIFRPPAINSYREGDRKHGGSAPLLERPVFRVSGASTAGTPSRLYPRHRASDTRL